MSTRIQLRRGTAAQWASVNPILAVGEPGYERDTAILRIGDGVQHFVDLPGLSVGGSTGGDADTLDGHDSVYFATAADLTDETARALAVEAAKADLVAGKVPTSQIPAIALLKPNVVVSQAAMLALTAQPGDMALRTDIGRSFVLAENGDPTVLADWIELPTPTDAVTSVNGQQGVVVLGAADVGADPAGTASTAVGAEATTRATADNARALKAGDTFTGEVVVPDLSVVGITGSTQGGRIVGFSAGTPTVGAHLLNDLVYDVTNNVWLRCSVAGTPGTWVAEGSGTYASVLELTKKAPSGPITFAEATGTAYQPLSVGTDGYVYGCNDSRLVRSNDGFATASLGPKFVDLGGVGSIVFASKLTEGYLVILSTDTTSGKTGEAWFSTSFTTGWAKVADFQSVVGLSISRPVHITAGTVMIVGDYVTNLVNASANLHLTRDGGQTWTTIRTKNQTSTAYNNHWHGSCYDPTVGANGRIWLAGGDGPQDIWGYSDDWGATWTDVPSGSGAGPDEPGVSIYNHPTLVINCTDRLCVTPDGSASRAGVWTVDKSTGLMTVAHEAAPTWGYGQFARGPYAQSSDLAEVYVLFPPGVTDVTNAAYLSGTGDGGKSWHRLWSAPVVTGTDFYTTGVVGPDSSGRIFIGWKVGSTWHTLVGTKPKWQATVVGGAPSLRSTVLTGDAYGSTWSKNMDPPTKDAVYNKVEDILNGVTFTGDVVVPDEAYDATAWDGSLEVPTKNALRDKIESLSVGGTTNLSYTAAPAQGTVVSDTGTDAVIPVADTTNAGLLTPAQVARLTVAHDWDLPTGALAQTIPRSNMGGQNLGVLTTARLTLVAIPLRAGMTVSTITFVSGPTTAISGQTHQWFALYDSSRNLLRVTNDDTTAAWAQSALKTLTLATTYPVTTSGLYYVGICVVATTPPSLDGATGISAVNGAAPILAGLSSTTGLSDPASAPNPAGALTANSGKPYAYVS